MYNIEDIYSFVSGKISIALSETTDLQNVANYKVIDIRKKLPLKLWKTINYGTIHFVNIYYFKYKLILLNFHKL